MTAFHMVPDTYVLAQEQLLLFGGACLLGIPIGLLADILRLLRRLLPHHSLLVMLEDILFLLGASLLLLGYTHAFAGGIFRLYYAAGCLIGFILHECTLGLLIMQTLGKVCEWLQRLLSPCRSRIALFCKKVCGGFVRNHKKRHKVQENVQNPLQEPPVLVYNKE